MRGNPIKEERRLEDFELHQERSPVRTAREIGVDVPPLVLAAAHEVIE